MKLREHLEIALTPEREIGEWVAAWWKEKPSKTFMVFWLCVVPVVFFAVLLTWGR